MGASVVIFAFLPWLDRSPVKSIRYRGPIYKTFLTLFVISFFIPATSARSPVVQGREDLAGVQPDLLLASSC